MGIGKRIKEARNSLGITQEDLAKKLGITKGAVANYENETSHPKEPVMYKLIDVLGVDANYLFQDVVKIAPKTLNVSLTEFSIIKKYRDLDTHGKDMVDTVLDKEWERSTKQNVEPLQLKLMAAHNDSAMDNEELAKMRSDIDMLERLPSKK